MVDMPVRSRVSYCVLRTTVGYLDEFNRSNGRAAAVTVADAGGKRGGVRRRRPDRPAGPWARPSGHL